MMQINVTRINERRYASRAIRADGVTAGISGAGHLLPLPHDLVHYAVERTLRLERGFWGSVAAGAVFPGMTVLDGRRQPHAEERSRALIKANGAAITQAEVLAGVFDAMAWRQIDRDPSAAAAMLAEAWSAGEPVAMPHETVVHVCAALREMATHWQALPPGGTLTVTWDLPIPSGNRPARRDRRHGVIGHTIAG